MNVKMGEGDNMEKHLQTVQSLKRKCEEQGEAISENVYVAILLNSVSEEYKITVTIHKSQDKLTPMSIINRLMEEYRGMSPAIKMAIRVRVTELPNSEVLNQTNHRIS